MPCYFPLQATFELREDGKKSIKFSDVKAKLFSQGLSTVDENSLKIPCGQCMGCRLERSRQWAVRCMHEAKFYEHNCFVTLTYSPEYLPLGGTLVRKHVQDFLKRLRKRFEPQKIRYYYCGEYGEKLDRPHYHLCLFNLDFPDKKRTYQRNGNWYYASDILSSLWKFGISDISDFSYETAAYVARYCTKKITGEAAKDYYGDKIPEFAGMSLKPGLGYRWFDKYAKTDVIPHDNVIVNSKESKLPRYYDVLWERIDPDSFVKAKQERKDLGEQLAFDNTKDRLAVKYKILKSKVTQLVRKFDLGNDVV